MALRIDPKKAPWSDVQVSILNKYQEDATYYPYTCGSNSSHKNLVATTAGWVCPDCDFTQDWY